MATKIFSSRADEVLLAFADGLTQREYGLSFGQYCGTKLLESIRVSGSLPDLSDTDTSSERREAAAFIKGFSALARNPAIATLSDDDIRALIASRYG